MWPLLAWVALGALIGLRSALRRTAARAKRARARLRDMDPGMRRSLARGATALRRLVAGTVGVVIGAVVGGALWSAVLWLLLSIA